MRVALVHDWLGTYRGGEKVLEGLASIFPDAPIYTLFFDSQGLPDTLVKREVITPRGFGGLFKLRKALLPLLPAAIETLDLGAFDLIISSSSCVAKGVIPAPHARHICYMHSPMRYIWDQRHQYLTRSRAIWGLGLLIEVLMSRLRVWDVASNSRVDCFVANSSFVAQRIRRFYRRDAEVVHPFIAQHFFSDDVVSVSDRKEQFLICGAQVPYKRFDLAIEWANKSRKKLLVLGDGPDHQLLRQLAGPTVQFVRNPTDQQLTQHMRESKALIFPGVEDFGMIPVESMACGTPVIALGHGGVMDYLRPGENGIAFEHQSVESLEVAVEQFGKMTWVPVNVRQSVQDFSPGNFRKQILKLVDKVMESN